MHVIIFIQYFAWNRPWYSLRGLHIRITWFSSKTKWYGTTFGIPNFPTPSWGFPQWKAMDFSQEEKNEVSTIMFDENLDWDNWDGKW